MKNLFRVGDMVWVTSRSCHAEITVVRRSIGRAYCRYDIRHDDGEVFTYVEETDLYPSRTHNPRI